MKKTEIFSLNEQDGFNYPPGAVITDNGKKFGGISAKFIDRLIYISCAAGGIAAWVMPLHGLLAIIPSIFVCIALYLAVSTGVINRLGFIISIVCLLAGLGGVVAPTLPASLIGASLLMSRRLGRNEALALLILALHFSYALTIESIIADFLAQYNLEAAGATVVLLIGMAIIYYNAIVFIIVGFACTICCAYILRYYNCNPDWEMGIIAAQALITVSAFLCIRNRGSLRAAFVLYLLIALPWINAIPNFHTPRHVSIILPDWSEDPDFRHFRGMAEALRHAGLSVSEPKDINEVGEHSYVILPWLSVPLRSDEAAFIAQFRRLASERRWTVIMFGEHDGMGNADTRAAQFAQRPIFRRDQTVPPGNGDTSGPAHIAAIRAWPQWSIFNRGATTHSSALSARVLISVDGWWSDRDIQEWLWTGDYRWRPGDRAGRLSLAHSISDHRGATWVGVGDTSPILTRQIIADPRPLLHLLDLASLIPAALHDLALFMVAICLTCLYRRDRSVIARFLARVAPIVGLAAATCGILLPTRFDHGFWRDHYLGEGGFEPSNFAAGLASEPSLLSTGWRFSRSATSVSGRLVRPREPTVSFLTIHDEARAGDVKFSRCRRLGGLDADNNGPRLMNAQACNIDGNGDVLVGDPSAAAVVQINDAGSPWIIVLDQGFLAENAPSANAEWLLGVLRNATPR